MFPLRIALAVALGAEVVAGHVSSLRGAPPSRNHSFEDNATAELSLVVGYINYAHLNCYTGHGGDALGPNDGLQAGVNNVDECGRAADRHGGVCFVYFWEQNKCFLRTQCNLDACEVGAPGTESYSFDTFTPGPVGAECLVEHGQGKWTPYSSGTLACSAYKCDPGYMITDMACVPINYIKSEHDNCYSGHGGTALGPNDGLQDGAHDVEGCKNACNYAEGCSCFVFFSKYNQCFLRSECNLGQCERGVPGEESYDFDTYMASAGSQSALAETSLRAERLEVQTRAGGSNWWRKGGFMRTIGTGCWPFDSDQPTWLSDKEAFIKELVSQGVTAINLNSVYDSGSDPSKTPALFGWCGLPGNDWLQPNPKVFPNGTSDVTDFVDKAHSHGIAVISWMNPSYVWTNSSYFKQAEQAYCLDPAIMADVEHPCNWFNWREHEETCATCDRPEDDFSKDERHTWPEHGPENETGGYVNDGKLDYYSWWAWQPTVDWNHAATQQLWKGKTGIIDTWSMLDGFLYDDPTAYLPGGYKTQGWDAFPNTNKEQITDPVREKHGSTFAQFAELYANDGPALAEQYGLDVYLADDGDFNRANYLQSALSGKNPTLTQDCYWTDNQQCDSVEDAFTGKGGLDAANNHCARTGWCVTAWLRLNALNGGDDAAAVNALQLGLAMSAGYYAAIEVVGNDWWSPYPYADEHSSWVRAISGAVTSNSDALAGNALRGELAQHLHTSGAGYVMLRYDALYSGAAALVAFNFKDSPGRFEVDLSSVPLDNQQPIDLLTNQPAAPVTAANHAAYPVTVEGRNATLLGKLKLPVWKSHANKNCWITKGSTWPEGDQSIHTFVPLQSCLLACFSEPQCSAVTVQWEADQGHRVSCYLRQVKVDDVSQCADFDDYHTFTYSA